MRHVGNIRYVVVSLLVLTAWGSAQNKPATLSGIIVDATGASLPKAQVLLVGLQDLETRKAEVPINGRFNFAGLAPGQYVIIATGPKTAPCFRPDLKRVEVPREAAANIRFTLKIDMERCPEPVQ